MSSNPPPSQLRTLIGGTCNASGNLTLKSIVPSRSFYSVFTAILKVTAGAPQWEIDLLGVPVGIGGGGVVVMGAIYANPGESFTLIVSGAAPNAVVSGGLYGFLSDTPETLPQLGVSSGSAAGSGGGGALPSGQSRVDGSLTNVGDTVSIAVGGSAAVGFESPTVFLSGTTLALEGTTDDVGWIGSSLYWLSGWYTADPFPPAGFGYSGAQPVQIPAAGLSQVRARLKTLGGGQTLPITVTLRATPGGTLAWPVGARAAAQSLGVVLATDQPAITVVPSYTGQKATYWISSGNVSKAIGAAGTEQLLVIYHPNTVAELFKVRRIILTLESNTVATILTIRVRRLNGTTAPSGGTALVALAALGSDAALNASDVLQTYPTTKGSVDTGAAATLSWALAISAAPTDVTKVAPIPLYDWRDSPEGRPLTIRASVAEGWAVEMNSSAASTVVASVAAEVTQG